MGVACVSSQERATASWTACVAHVAVSPSGEVKVKKLTVATDVGMQVHPDNIRAQVEGAALWGLSLAMYEKATLKDGGIEQTNFDTYTPLRMSQTPEVAVNVIANGEKADRRRRAGGDGDRACARQRDLQRLRRAHPLAADHGRSGEGEHEGVRRRSIDKNDPPEAMPPADFLWPDLVMPREGGASSTPRPSRVAQLSRRTGSSAFADDDSRMCTAVAIRQIAKILAFTVV